MPGNLDVLRAAQLGTGRREVQTPSSFAPACPRAEMGPAPSLIEWDGAHASLGGALWMPCPRLASFSLPQALLQGFLASALWHVGRPSLSMGPSCPLESVAAPWPPPPGCQSELPLSCDNSDTSRHCPTFCGAAKQLPVETCCPTGFSWEHCPMNHFHRNWVSACFRGARPLARHRLAAAGQWQPGLRAAAPPATQLDTIFDKGRGDGNEAGLTNPPPTENQLLRQSRILGKATPSSASGSPLEPLPTLTQISAHLPLQVRAVRRGQGRSTWVGWDPLPTTSAAPRPPQPRWAVTSLLGGYHQGLSGLSPALAGLGCDAKQVDGLWLEAGGRVLAGAGCQHLHRGRVGRGGVEPMCDLVSCGKEGHGLCWEAGQLSPVPWAPPAVVRRLEAFLVILVSSAATWGVWLWGHSTHRVHDPHGSLR